MRIIGFAAGAALALTVGLLSSSAQAASLFTLAGPTPEMASPGSISETFSAGAGAGQATFRINGYTSLDGNANCCTDIFTLSLNGTAILSGSWDMGGGGANVVFFAPAGATVSPATFGFFQGGRTDISTPLSLLAGNNTLTFAYDGVFQGLDDEGWGLQNVSVTGAAAVPEPASWALLIVGFFGAGGLLRRARSTAAPVIA